MAESRRARLKKQAGFEHHQLVLLAIILILGLSLVYKTISYFKQVVVETNTVALTKGPGLEYQKLASLTKGSRLKVLDHKYHWYQVKTSTGQIGWIPDWVLANKYRLKPQSLSEATIVLDAGHGGSDSGALSNSDKKEKDYTLKYIKQLASKLKEQGAKVYFTRDSDKFVSLKARPELAEKLHADAFISIHFDSSPNPNEASGITSYYYHKTSSKPLAYYISSHLDNLGLDNRGTEFGDFLVIRDNTIPAVLVELGYINTSQDFALITTANYQDSATDGIVTGLKAYFNAKANNN